MTIREIEAKSILRKYRKIDSWFISHYGMNLYRGCLHNCVYCDGRAERYYVEGDFGKEVTVKVNALDILSRELDPARKRAPLKRSFVMLGGGVGDSYQPAEREYRLSRRTLHLLHERGLPVHVLTKSTLVERDADILTKINEGAGAIVSFSFSSADGELSALFEPGVPPPAERLKILSLFKSRGIACGMFLLPIIPFITDRLEVMEKTVRSAKEAGLDFIIFGGMTLKEGRQKDHFLSVLSRRYPELVEEYNRLYRGNPWGEATGSYYGELDRRLFGLSKKYEIPPRIPLRLYKDILSENDRVTVILEHLDYLLRMEGRSSPYGYAAHSISRLKEPLSTMQENLRSLSGVGKATESIIREILETGTSTLYRKLMPSSPRAPIR